MMAKNRRFHDVRGLSVFCHLVNRSVGRLNIGCILSDRHGRRVFLISFFPYHLTGADSEISYFLFHAPVF